jgi:hypothetical protein
MKKIFPSYIVTFWSLYNHFLHFRKKRHKILKNVLSKNVLELLSQINSSYRLLNFKNRLLLTCILCCTLHFESIKQNYFNNVNLLLNFLVLYEQNLTFYRGIYYLLFFYFAQSAKAQKSKKN